MSSDRIDLGALISSRYERLVAAEPGKAGMATLYKRHADATTEALEIPFRPWLLVSGEALAELIPNTSDIVRLEGPGIHNVRAHFPDIPTYSDATTFLKKTTGANPSSPLAPYRIFGDPTQQLLSLLPARLFRDMAFGDVRRMQLDIETLTTPGYDFPNADREGDAIVMVGLHDSTGWECCVSGPELDEAEILRETVRLIRERDPDVIEGHNIFNFDLPYIETRCKRHKVKLNLGRDGSRISARSSRFTAGERTSAYRRYDIHGRHVVDTLHLVLLYDASHRDMPGHGLKAAARYFGVAAPSRTYINGGDIGAMYQQDPQTLRAYCLDDVRETAAVSTLLSPSYFYQAQLVPYSYQNCITRGNATRIDAMLVAAYVLEGESLPTPQPVRSFRGGLTESLRSGVFRNVWHVDVRSLYPSIIIAERLCPRADSLNIFHSLLTELRNFRLVAKDAARTAPPEARDHFDALQSSFKILINSFYGYTGFQQGTFNDFDMAETITARGREILQRMLEFLESAGATVIEMDTDGIYFVPPAGIDDTTVMQERVQGILPEGIDVDLDATYAAMFGYKSKNYALLNHDGKVSITGAALKSRGLEPFQTRCIQELVTLLLTGQTAKIEPLFERYAEDIRSHRLPLENLAKREVLSSAPAAYREKLEAGKTRRSAAYELVLKAGREYRQGDQVAFYVTGDRKNVSVTEAAKLLADAAPSVRDENIAYYLDKLAKVRQKFAEFIDT